MAAVLYMIDEGFKTNLHIFTEAEVGQAVLRELKEEVEKLSEIYDSDICVSKDGCSGYLRVPKCEEHFQSKLSQYLPDRSYISFNSFQLVLQKLPTD